jgi:hypothetical protein
MSFVKIGKAERKKALIAILKNIGDNLNADNFWRMDDEGKEYIYYLIHILFNN